MQLFPLNNDDISLAEGWLAEPENYKWLHFGQGIQKLHRISLSVMLTRDSMHAIRLFGENRDDPLGIVALTDINPTFRTASLWYVLGEKSAAGRGCTTKAARKLLQEGFEDLGLASVFAWAVAENTGSVKVLTNCGFSYIGTRRKAHLIDGELRDVQYYDLLSGEINHVTNSYEHVTAK